MAPSKNKKKNKPSEKSTPKQVKMGKINSVAAESTWEEILSNNKVCEDEKNGDGNGSVSANTVKKPCTWLRLDRLDPPTGKKSSVQNSKQGNKEETPVAQDQAKNDNTRKRGKGEETGADDHKQKMSVVPQKKEKEIANENREDQKSTDVPSGENLGGMIFMCNAKTKPDCFHYQLMGVSANNKEVVMGIKLGLKLFLYDYDLKLMYGIFEASSAGGMRLEPAAFGGSFPAQIRFTVLKECIPLPENVFKKAIRESYDERTHKFDTKLTVKQVKNLTDMFRPTPWLHQSGKSSIQEVSRMTLLNEEPLFRQRYVNSHHVVDAGVYPTYLHHENQFSEHPASLSAVASADQLFLTEHEYRSFGLRQCSHPLPKTVVEDEVCHSWESNKLNVNQEQLQSNAVMDPTVHPSDPFFISEKVYHPYGRQQAPNAASPMILSNEIVGHSCKDAHNPYNESTESLVNRYLAMPMGTSTPEESCFRSGRENFIISGLNRNSDISTPSGILNSGGEKSCASYSLREPLELNQRPASLYASPQPLGLDRPLYLQHESDLASAPVTRRYSYSDPSVLPHY